MSALPAPERGMSSNGNGHRPDRWDGIDRPYTPADVERLRGSVTIEHTLARLGAERLWELLHSEPYVAALGAMTGGQAVQMVKAGLQAIYLSVRDGRSGGGSAENRGEISRGTVCRQNRETGDY